MLIKLIECAVLDHCRSQFARGQAAWCALTSCNGFLAQLGGWCADDPNGAIIVGFWRDDASYRHFMENVHDSIFDSNGQRGTYDPSRSSTSLWRAIDECLPIVRRIVSDRDPAEVLASAKISADEASDGRELPRSFRVIRAESVSGGRRAQALVLGFGPAAGFPDQIAGKIGYTRVDLERTWTVSGRGMLEG